MTVSRKLGIVFFVGIIMLCGLEVGERGGVIVDDTLATSDPEISAIGECARHAGTVYGLVADVTRMGEWSPETTSCRWRRQAGGAEVGARFRGANRNGWHRWVTVCRGTAAEPGSEFTLAARSGVSISRDPTDW